jgi:hypothetical protein
LALVGARLSTRFTAKRIIQAGFVVTAVGLLAILVSIQPNIAPSDLAVGGILGMGLGLIASQILNLILSSVPQKDTAETAGLSSTFEQLGNSIGVALVGTIMLTTLSLGLQQEVRNSDLPPEIKEEAIQSVEQGVQLMSTAQIEQGLTEAGLEPTMIAELQQVYGEARTSAFRGGVALLLAASLFGLVFSVGLTNRKLVAEPPS